LLGGSALGLGSYAHLAALALCPARAVPARLHRPNGWVHTSAGGGWEYPAFLIAASLALWLLGDGAGALRRSTVLVPDGAAA
jgi:putative oxidoreductase